MKKRLTFILFWFSPILLWGQNCKISIKGYAADLSTKMPLAYATVYMESTQRAVQTDENGYFEMSGLCADSTHIRISHVNCQFLRQFLVLRQDTTLRFSLLHHDELVNEVHIHGNKSNSSTAVINSLGQPEILRRSNQDLSEILTNIVGVNQLKTGAGISKPVIQGLYGNRIAILNNGVLQGGQQWGNDHAPEIDPFAADHISVVKGASVLAYPGNPIGGLVLVEPVETGNDPHVHGGLNYIFESNGLGSTLNADVGKGGEKSGWRFKGTIKLKGDMKAPDYFLTNTGKREENGSFLWEFSKNRSWRKSIYLSSFNTQMGVLRGSHIGNLSDLEEAVGRTEPFFTSDKFSYQINAPSQKVSHHLLKASFNGELPSNQIIKLNYGLQLNQRKEFDVRRSGRSDSPALSLNQWTQQLDFSYEKEIGKGNYLKAGIIGQYINTTNVAETGILPLIPDYLEYDESAYLIYQKDWGKWFAELGGRADFQQYQVWEITRTLPHEIVKHKHSFSSARFSGGIKYIPNNKLTLNANLGIAKRAPAVNELYSYGLHQGISSIEIGSSDLSPERSFKIIISTDVKINQSVLVQVGAYFQKIADYIYLQPASEPLLTIRGAFPVYYYKQTDARIKGLDFMLTYEPWEKFRWVSKASIIRGEDRSNNIPLVYMPSNNLQQRLEFNLNEISKLKSPQIALNWRTVFKQQYLNENQDFLAPPPTYNLFDLEINTALLIKNREVGIAISATNLLNTNYRNYLNRQRYFADEPGRSVNLRLAWSF